MMPAYEKFPYTVRLVSDILESMAWIEKVVTYTLELDCKLFVIENVPARVNEETGEQFFSPQTVERLQEIVEGAERPIRILETPVFDYAA